MLKKYCLLITICNWFVHILIAEQTTSDHAITIFIHGTYPIPYILKHTPFRKLIYCPQGISLAKNLPYDSHFYKIAQGCVKHNEARYSFDQFYLFGWPSHKVSDKIRHQAAHDLVKALEPLVHAYYQKHNVWPKIRMIGFSHGGNVILNTALFLTSLIENCGITTEIWLFATPVQHINHHLINHPNFNKIYSIYSKTDWLQKMDPQGLYTIKARKNNNFWSNRTFDNNAQCIQVNFTVNHQSISHSYYRYILPYFSMIQELVEHASDNLSYGNIDININI